MTNYATPLMRLGELYLMAAECYANIEGGTAKGLEYLNKIRKRAGVPEWTEAKLRAAGKHCSMPYWKNVLWNCITKDSVTTIFAVIAKVVNISANTVIRDLMLIVMHQHLIN